MYPESGTAHHTSPPYVSFATFKSLLHWLETEGVPHRFDRSFWRAKFSGTNGTQLVAALRFLGLLDVDDPDPRLERLVHATTGDRKALLAELLRASYDGVIFDELSRATPAMVREWFAAYPVDGDTRRKAVSFFVNAAKEAEIPLSNAVGKMARSRGARSTGRSRPEGDAPSRDGPVRGDARRLGGHQTTIRLASGGEVSLKLAVDLFNLSSGDREFVLKLVDLTRSYTEAASNDDPRPHASSATDRPPS